MLIIQEIDQTKESIENKNEIKNENPNEEDNVSELPSISLIIESFPLKKGKSVESLDAISAVEVLYCVQYTRLVLVLLVEVMGEMHMAHVSGF